MVRPRSLPYGNWKSPITAELITSQSLSLGSLAIDGQDIYWLEGRPSEGGRYALLRLSPGQAAVECLPSEFNVRSRVHEYGGGAYAVHRGVIHFVNFRDQQLYKQQPGDKPKSLTREGYRYADLIFDPTHEQLICVREDHTQAGEAVNTLVRLPLSDPQDGLILAAGHDFYSDPRLSHDGTRLAWLCWDHPNMPWDGCELWVARLNPDGSICTPEKVAGGPEEFIFQPEWSPQDMLYFISDASGWWNLHRLKRDGGIEPLCPMEAEFGKPQWEFGIRTYGFLNDNEILCTYSAKGSWKLANLDPSTGALTPISLPFTEIGDIHTGSGFAVFGAASPNMPHTLLKYDPGTASTVVLRRSFEPTVDSSYFSQPEEIEFPTADSLTAHGFHYPPANPDYAAPEGSLPPLLVFIHGGPTASTGSGLRYAVQYWTSRGFAVLDVNHGGSSGFGRAYRMRLKGRWGIVDVADCCNGARWLAEQKWVDSHRLAIHGGSAGGFTTLAALVTNHVFQAGTSRYGICDLEALARDTHKFESHYLESLVGAYPQAKAIYIERSPIHHAADLSAAILFMQGDSDPVVPPDQSRRMFGAVRAKGIPTAFLLFEGEQHGFRIAANIKRSYEAEFYFYSKLFDFVPAEEIEPVQIENLP